MNKRKVPKLRFKGFTDDWEQRKYSDIAITRRGLTYKPENIVDGGKRVLRSSNINEDTFEIHDEDVFVDEEAVNIPYVKNGDILITSANGSSRLVGKHAIIRNIPDNSVVHGGFMLLASSEEPEFVNALMSSQWYTKFINVYVAGGNGAIGNLNKNDLDEQLVLVPSKPEREKIGTYFSNLDNLITLHQRKLEKLKIIKKSMLENCFPKNGEKIPKFRFDGFSGDWEQRKLGDYVDIVSGDAPSKFEEGNELYVKVDDLNYNLKYVTDSQSKVAIHKSIKKASKGSVVFPKRGAAIMTNKVRILAEDSYMDTNMMALSSDKIDSEFLYNTISKEGLYKIADTSTIPQINNKHIEPYEVMLPDLEEQKRIGGFFKDTDNLITLHQRKLEKLKVVKKSMLESMFV